MSQTLERTRAAVTTTAVPLVTTAETVVCTLSGISPPSASGRVILRGLAQLTTGADTTAVTPRIRRGTTASGTLVGEGNPITIGAAAGSTESFEIAGVDFPPEMNNGSYVLTLECTAASANGSCIYAELEATLAP